MRLLNTTTLTLKEFPEDRIPPYAILSHCWSHAEGQEEASYQQLASGSVSMDSYGWQKIVRCCDLARSRALHWTWIDTVCIDRSSSAELSEAINSMYSWYQRSTECYAFLDDVRWTHEDDQESATNNKHSNWERFRQSRWFTRGWTLQELLAPGSVLFYARDGTFIGSRSELANDIYLICGIDREFLNQARLMPSASIAQRMSWASNRRTTRPEDMAYSLLGIFDVNMPLLYGEGEKAFLRLQLEIINRCDDDSIFAWNIETLQDSTYRQTIGVLAPTPHEFDGSGNVVKAPLLISSGNRCLSQPTSKAVEFRSKVIPIGLRRYVAVALGVESRVQFITLACRMQGKLRNDHLSMAVRRDPNSGKCYRTGLHLHRPHLVLDFLCHLLFGERVVHLAPVSDAPESVPTRFDGLMASLYVRNMAEGAAASFMTRLLLAVIILLLLTHESVDNNAVGTVVVGFLVGARAIGSVWFCILYWLFYQTFRIFAIR